ncbi:TIGR04255 family protein [Paraburkholderia caffeinilytica]|uniref:TIGR04255 family protein n=1 Tax=Paraburkholderia caffeinilytica TaxID=1761016 RepID=A0ABQ1MUV4_9BURK|nr:TIGR04255 family protein [Paraburkholderia caffeinilytica]GGC43449.1 hypothetical protein GCM10011400_33060 [Paraburkholderia caffeinilytica]CAB3790370.1 hypothetical protein LMG28690_03077 [Paraburkholderia caffeinilytica]
MGTIYKNPSLVEVICELHWELTAVAMPAVGGIDPFFDVVRADLTPRLIAAGFPQSQELAPPQVPRQFLAWQPVVRFAPTADTWPKVQLGPGLLTVNMAGQPYTGWPDFQPSVASAVSALLESFPTPNRFLRLKSLQLKYINAFTDKHDFQTYAQFTSKYLGLRSVLPDRFIESIGTAADVIATNSQTRIPVVEPRDSHVVVQVAEAQINQAPGCVLQLSIEKSGATEHGLVMQWFENAHALARKTFLSLVKTELINLMQPEEKK